MWTRSHSQVDPLFGLLGIESIDMRFSTFLTSGVEVLHLGTRHTGGNAWPEEHWKSHKGRWRLHMPAVDSYLSQHLAASTFGQSVDSFVFLMQIADFAKWGRVFTQGEGRVRYQPKIRQVGSVGKIEWNDVQRLSAREQLKVLGDEIAAAIQRVDEHQRKPRDFHVADFAAAVSELLRSAKVSEFGRTRYRRDVAS